ncbi:hypothetical protein GE09DRAFT_568418 [Coniochaeta sp. 2T2.1]|nr:hypothetical protein GE09DRAFT_568418 [Coniochaeta sp. 2T2.1]
MSSMSVIRKCLASSAWCETCGSRTSLSSPRVVPQNRDLIFSSIVLGRLHVSNQGKTSRFQGSGSGSVRASLIPETRAAAPAVVPRDIPHEPREEHPAILVKLTLSPPPSPLDRPRFCRWTALLLSSAPAWLASPPALHISKMCPCRPQSLISLHSPMEPSNDHSKIVRIDYENVERMREAQTAQSCWMEGSFARYYYREGRLVAYWKDSIDTLKSIVGNRSQLGLEARRVGGKELLEGCFGPTTANALRTSTFVHNPDDAIIDWRPCIQEHESKAEVACIQSGGSIYQAKVETLEHDTKRVTALILVDGRRIDTKDTDIVLAIGPWTVEVLKRSKIDLPPEGRVPTATGLFAFRDKAQRYPNRAFQA